MENAATFVYEITYVQILKEFKIIAANADEHIHGYILECVDITIDNSMHPKKMEWR